MQANSHDKSSQTRPAPAQAFPVQQLGPESQLSGVGDAAAEPANSPRTRTIEALRMENCMVGVELPIARRGSQFLNNLKTMHMRAFDVMKCSRSTRPTADPGCVVLMSALKVTAHGRVSNHTVSFKSRDTLKISGCSPNHFNLNKP